MLKFGQKRTWAVLGLSAALMGGVALSDGKVAEARSVRAQGDMDRDGIPNHRDRDRDGDGVRNRLDRHPNSRRASDRNWNRNRSQRVPFGYSRDRDRDGRPDYRDNDRDGDGILNSRDRWPNRWNRPGTTTLYRSSSDMDRDGIPNSRDRDRDGDGRRNERDRYPNQRARW